MLLVWQRVPYCNRALLQDFDRSHEVNLWTERLAPKRRRLEVSISSVSSCAYAHVENSVNHSRWVIVDSVRTMSALRVMATDRTGVDDSCSSMISVMGYAARGSRLFYLHRNRTLNSGFRHHSDRSHLSMRHRLAWRYCWRKSNHWDPGIVWVSGSSDAWRIRWRGDD